MNVRSMIPPDGREKAELPIFCQSAIRSEQIAFSRALPLRSGLIWAGASFLGARSQGHAPGRPPVRSSS